MLVWRFSKYHQVEVLPYKRQKQFNLNSATAKSGEAEDLAKEEVLNKNGVISYMVYVENIL